MSLFLMFPRGPDKHVGADELMHLVRQGEKVGLCGAECAATRVTVDGNHAVCGICLEQQSQLLKARTPPEQGQD